MVEQFERSVMEPEAGIRAVWLLYKRGRWSYLEDFGIDRQVAERAFQRFEQTHVIGDRLTKVQIRRLAKVVPGLVGAARELRLAYALRFYSENEDRYALLTGPSLEHPG